MTIFYPVGGRGVCRATSLRQQRDTPVVTPSPLKDMEETFAYIHWVFLRPNKSEIRILFRSQYCRIRPQDPQVVLLLLFQDHTSIMLVSLGATNGLPKQTVIMLMHAIVRSAVER